MKKTKSKTASALQKIANHNTPPVAAQAVRGRRQTRSSATAVVSSRTPTHDRTASANASLAPVKRRPTRTTGAVNPAPRANGNSDSDVEIVAVHPPSRSRKTPSLSFGGTDSESDRQSRPTKSRRVSSTAAAASTARGADDEDDDLGFSPPSVSSSADGYDYDDFVVPDSPDDGVGGLDSPVSGRTEPDSPVLPSRPTAARARTPNACTTPTSPVRKAAHRTRLDTFTTQQRTRAQDRSNTCSASADIADPHRASQISSGFAAFASSTAAASGRSRTRSVLSRITEQPQFRPRQSVFRQIAALPTDVPIYTTVQGVRSCVDDEIIYKELQLTVAGIRQSTAQGVVVTNVYLMDLKHYETNETIAQMMEIMTGPLMTPHRTQLNNYVARMTLWRTTEYATRELFHEMDRITIRHSGQIKLFHNSPQLYSKLANIRRM